jgi:hypothetical protein
MENKQPKDKFVKLWNEEGEQFYGGGIFNNVVDIVLSVLTVVASLAAACLAVSDVRKRWLIALLAGLPATFTSIQAKVGIRERSDWYFFYASEVRSLALDLECANSPNLEDFAKRRGKLEKSMEAEWKKIARHMPKFRRRRG